jgi:UDP-N-acetylmuramate dehydrogenase
VAIMNDKINKVLNKLSQILRDDQITIDAEMKLYTTFKAGGKASILVTPESSNEIIKIKAICFEENLECFLMGNGSNLLVSDKGYNGLIMKLGSGFEKCYVDGDVLYAQSGALLSKVTKIAATAGLSGLEFASGIPGSVGGAIYMNAGAYDGEIRDTLISARCIDKNGKIVNLAKDDMEFSYRKSIFWHKDYVIIEGCFQLEPDNEDDILQRMRDFNKRRNEKQPINLPSAGSTFKRPDGYYAGKLIEDAGLKGLTHGGASVSKLHAGFIVNDNNATADEIIELIQIVTDKVHEKSGVTLEPEIRILGGAK